VTSQPGPPRAAKPPYSQEAPWALRFVLGQDAVAGTVLDLDFATGRLMPAEMAGISLAEYPDPVAEVPIGPSPGMALRALANGWRSRAAALQARTTVEGPDRELAREALACAGELDAALDYLGVVKP
jgi:hypothetical protein